MPLARVPPGPRARWLRGSLEEFGRDRLGFFTRCARDYGDVAAFRLGPRPCLLLSHPDLIEYVLLTASRNFTKHFAVRLNRLLLGNGLINSEGDFWLRQRRLAQPGFVRERVVLYADTMAAATERHVADWQDGQTRDLHAEMMRLTLEIVGLTLFGADVAAETHDVSAALEVALTCYVARVQSLLLLPEWLPTPNNRRLRQAVGRLDDILYRIIRQRRAGDRERDDLLSMLLRARDEGGGSMTDRQLRDEAMTLFLAGHETTALALTWAWYLLGRHPEVEAALLAELQAVLGGRAPTAADLPRLRYTERLVCEVLRLYPPVYTIGREALADCEIGGYRVRAGTTVFLSQWVMHHDPRYFEDPDAFRPDRWADDLARRLPKYAYFPFGGGPRVCIGNSFATMEAVLVLAIIAQKFRLAPASAEPVRPRAFLTLRPERAVPMVLARR